DFVVDQRVVVFLGAQGPTIPHVVGFNQGVFRIVRAQDDSGWLVTPPPNVPGVVAVRVVRGDTSRRPVPLADFEQRVRTLAGRARGGGWGAVGGRDFGRGGAVAPVVASAARPALGYQESSVAAGGRGVTLRWPRATVPSAISNPSVPNATPADFRGAAGRAF